jgi:hypothetical protein
MGILPQAHDLLANGDYAYFEAAMPDAWIDELAIAGSPENWEVAINRLVKAGAHTVILVPLADRGPEELDTFARHFMA